MHVFYLTYGREMVVNKTHQVYANLTIPEIVVCAKLQGGWRRAHEKCAGKPQRTRVCASAHARRACFILDAHFETAPTFRFVSFFVSSSSYI